MPTIVPLIPSLRTRGHISTATQPPPVASSDPYINLIGALLRQAVVDARSLDLWHRADARAFLQDPAQVESWLALTGLKDIARVYSRLLQAAGLEDAHG